MVLGRGITVRVEMMVRGLAAVWREKSSNGRSAVSFIAALAEAERQVAGVSDVRVRYNS